MTLLASFLLISYQNMYTKYSHLSLYKVQSVYNNNVALIGEHVHAPVVQWLNPLLSLSAAEFRGIRKSKESWGKLNKPLWVDGSSFSHIFLSSEHQFMVYQPTRKFWNVHYQHVHVFK